MKRNYALLKQDLKIETRIEKSIPIMYNEEDLALLPVFQGNFINWGYYEDSLLKKRMTKEQRILASQKLYDVCASYLDINKEDRLLEIGSGKGIGLKFLIDKYKLRDISVLDQSHFYLREIKKRYPNVNATQGNAENFELNQKFNKILSIEVAQHFNHMEKFLKNVKNHLTENGVFVFATFFGLIPKAKEALQKEIPTVQDEIDHIHHIESVEAMMKELDLQYEIISIGDKVFFGYDKWISQTSMKNCWSRNWIKAYKAGIIDYFIIRVVHKREKFQRSTPIDELMKAYSQNKIDKYDYIDKMNKINKSLNYFSKRLKDTDIKKIEILDDELIFTTRKEGIKLYFSGLDRRGAPFEILNFGNYEEEDNYFLKCFIKEKDVIFDIGANIGWYTLLFSKWYSQSQIYSFEPVPTSYEFLIKNVQLNNSSKNIHLYNLGMSNFCGLEKFYFCPEGSVIASTKNLVDSKLAKLVKCNVITLDDFVINNKITKMDFLKCDVEGGELLVLKAGLSAINRFLPIIFIELYHGWAYKFGYHPNDIINLLKKMGYSCFYPTQKILKKIKNLDEEPNEERLNYFFLHNKKHRNLIHKFT